MGLKVRPTVEEWEGVPHPSREPLHTMVKVEDEEAALEAKTLLEEIVLTEGHELNG